MLLATLQDLRPAAISCYQAQGTASEALCLDPQCISIVTYFPPIQNIYTCFHVAL